MRRILLSTAIALVGAASLFGGVAFAATTTGRYSPCISAPGCSFDTPGDITVDNRGVSGTSRYAIDAWQPKQYVYDYCQKLMHLGTTGGMKGWITIRHIDQNNKYGVILNGSNLQFFSDKAGHTVTLAKVPYSVSLAHPEAMLRIVADGYHFQIFDTRSGSPVKIVDVVDAQQAVAQGGNILLYTSGGSVFCWDFFHGRVGLTF